MILPPRPAFFLLTGLALLLYLPAPLNHDAAWHVQTALRVLQGDRLGIDVFDINPPMSAWLFTIPAAISIWTALAPGLVFKLFTVTVLCLSWGVSVPMLKGAGETTGAAAAVTLAALYFLLPGYDVAQREHLVLALVLPYALLTARRSEGTPAALLPALLLGLAAGIGVGIKPYFLAIPVGLELWLMGRRRQLFTFLRPEALALFAVLVLYLLAVCLFAPAYLFEIVPKAAVSYGGFEADWPHFGLTLLKQLAPALLVLALCRTWGGAPADRPGIQVLLVLAGAFLAAALLQKKGWSYQLYPVSALLLLAGSLCLRAGSASGRLGATAIALVVAAGPLGFLVSTYSATGTGDRVAAMTRLIRTEAGEGGGVFAFITSPRDVHPAVLEAGVRWAGASGVMVWLPAYLAGEEAAVRSPDWPSIVASSDGHLADILYTLEREKPAVILVKARDDQLGIARPGFDYVAFTQSRVAGFGPLWAAYEERPAIGSYRVFVRRKAQTP